MKFKIKKLFRFKKAYCSPGYALDWYRGADDETITELVIPERYRFRPVHEIFCECFQKCKYLQKVYVPDSIYHIDTRAFHGCDELREIRLPPKVSLGTAAFVKCPKLDPETVLKGCVGNFNNYAGPVDPVGTPKWDELLRPDVFELAIKYNCFCRIGTERLCNELILRGLVSHFEMLEQAGRSPSAEETDALIRFSVENKKTEITAYLLDLKNRKFGFNDFDGGVNFEL